MWPAVPDEEGGRPLAASWPRAAGLVVALVVVAYAALLAVPQAILSRGGAMPRTAREVLAALWFGAAFAAIVAALARAQRPRPPASEPGP
jgi:hypothetical protein